MIGYPKPSKRRKSSPAAKKTLLAELTNRDGHVCAWTGIDDDTLVPQHRSGRGMGGDRSKNRLANLVWLRSSINSLIEDDPWWAEEARRRGIKISLHADPTLTPIVHAVHGTVILSDDGSITPQLGGHTPADPF
ncbi:hypothetical protein [Mycetocola saprophilus]|uniref:hypothetical protein n=1 Tax=Mycetocola saprophilus TaxID=76636 RepID=UPI0012DCC317|nr:hypothetical protein [Mycetocola saprophilus]